MEYAPDARSIGELLSDLTREVGTLIRSELALARTELSDKAARVGRHGIAAGVYSDSGSCEFSGRDGRVGSRRLESANSCLD